MTNIILDQAMQIGVAFTALLIAVIVLLTWLYTRKNANPEVAAILDALKPYALEAIYGAETMALKALNDGDVLLQGADKKKLADSLYDALPDVLPIGGKLVPISFIKWVVPRPNWEQLVQDVFDVADKEISANEKWLQAQVDNLVKRAG